MQCLLGPNEHLLVSSTSKAWPDLLCLPQEQSMGETCSVSPSSKAGGDLQCLHQQQGMGEPSSVSTQAARHGGDLQGLPQQQNMGETCSVSSRQQSLGATFGVSSGYKAWGRPAVSPATGNRGGDLQGPPAGLGGVLLWLPAAAYSSDHRVSFRRGDGGVSLSSRVHVRASSLPSTS